MLFLAILRSSFDRHSHYVFTHSENLSLRHGEDASHWLDLILLLHLYALESFHTFFLQAVLQIKVIFHQKNADNFLSVNEVDLFLVSCFYSMNRNHSCIANMNKIDRKQNQWLSSSTFIVSSLNKGTVKNLSSSVGLSSDNMLTTG